MPATLAGAETSRRSSIRPVSQITVAAAITPRTFPGASNTGPNSGNRQATARATSRPMNKAVPPRIGVGFACTVRSPGWAMAPIFRDRIRKGGTEIAVAITATAITNKYGKGPTDNRLVGRVQTACGHAAKVDASHERSQSGYGVNLEQSNSTSPRTSAITDSSLGAARTRVISSAI